MTVSFIIPNWNRSDLLAAALGSIRAQTMAPLEVLVVDNGSTDDSVHVASRAGAKVLQMGGNRGFSFAVNRGLEAARGDAVAIVNNDVEFQPNWTATLTAALHHSGGWFAIGKLLDQADRDRIDGAGDAICRGGTSWRLGHGRPDGPIFDQERTTFFPSATALLARREFFERTGHLEEVFFSYLEDVELGLRAALLGLAGVYVPAAVAYHRGSATLGAWSAGAVRCITRNQILLLARFYPGRLLRANWYAVLVAQLLWGGLAARHKCGLAYSRGLASALLNFAAARRSGARWRSNGTQLARILARSEAELAVMQRATGWDSYWRWYFRLTRPAPEATA